MRTIFPVIALIAFGLVSLALIIAVSVGVGWLLTLVLPFSLFEGTVVGIAAGIATWLIWYNILRDATTYSPMDDVDDDDIEEIPVARFCKTEAEKTWENWFRYEFANSIYEDLLTSPQWGETDARELQEQAVRLADAALASLKKKSSRAKWMRVNTNILRRELVKAGHKPYDEDTLDLAAVAVNVELVHLEEQFRLVIKDALWAERAEMFW